jgi:hypothetical protein
MNHIEKECFKKKRDLESSEDSPKQEVVWTRSKVRQEVLCTQQTEKGSKGSASR